jgi:hypothetical protein
MICETMAAKKLTQKRWSSWARANLIDAVKRIQ